MNTTDTMNGYYNGCTVEKTIHIPTTDIADSYLHSDLSHWLTLYFLPVLVVIGTLGNLAFLLMVFRLRYMRTTVNAYFCSLAIVDSIYLLTVPALYIFGFLSSPVTNNFPFAGKYSCLSFYMFGYICYYLSIALLTVISYERYVAVCHPIHQLKTQGRSRTVILISVACVLAVALAVLTLPRRGKLVERCLAWPDDGQYIDMPTILRTCEPLGGNDEVIISMTNIVYVGFFFVALIITGFCYAKIIYALSHRCPDEHNGNNKQHAQNVAVRNQVTRAIVALGLVYFITQTPIRIGDLNEIIIQFGPGFLKEDQAALIETIGLCLLFLNSAVNSYIYIFSGSFYQRAFVETFFVCRSPKNDNQDSIRTSHV